MFSQTADGINDNINSNAAIAAICKTNDKGIFIILYEINANNTKTSKNNIVAKNLNKTQMFSTLSECILNNIANIIKFKSIIATSPSTPEKVNKFVAVLTIC